MNETANFKLLTTKNGIRRGQLITPHGVIETPIFMPIATVGALKGLLPSEASELGASIILGNTYHLMLRPGEADIKALGGLHKFMGWDKPILTDSGGYQVFSLAKMNKTTEEGVVFQSHLDGSRVELTPERSMAMQAAIGSDIRMQFDDVAAGNSERARYQEAMERSLRWAKRSKVASEEFRDDRHQLFGIVQGGIYEDLRERSLDGLLEIGFDGYAVGGLSVGEDRAEMFKMVKFLTGKMLVDRPRYFMGGGMPEEIVINVCAGIDMFDCVLPTRNARHGQIFVWAGEPGECTKKAVDLAQSGADDELVAQALYRKIHLTNESLTLDETPIDPFADNFNSLNFSKAYLRHAYKAGEIVGLRLATEQNVRFFLRLMEELRGIAER